MSPRYRTLRNQWVYVPQHWDLTCGSVCWCERVDSSVVIWDRSLGSFKHTNRTERFPESPTSVYWSGQCCRAAPALSWSAKGNVGWRQTGAIGCFSVSTRLSLVTRAAVGGLWWVLLSTGWNLLVWGNQNEACVCIPSLGQEDVCIAEIASDAGNRLSFSIFSGCSY